MPIRILSRAVVDAILDVPAVLRDLERGFRALTLGTCDVPPRTTTSVSGRGFLLAMPAWAEGELLGTKLVGVFPGASERNLPSHQATITLMDPETGAPLALLDGRSITAARTAGASALSARLLARPDARTMTIFGAGVQGAAHLRFFTETFTIDRVLVYSRSAEGARRLADTHPRAELAEEAEPAVAASDLVCLCTSAAEPVVEPGWLRSGTHVTSVGYVPPRGELDPRIATEHSLFVESRSAFRAAPAGAPELSGLDPASGTELGELLLERRSGRRSDAEVTVYKSMGHAIEDLVVASHVYREALVRGLGETVEL